MAGEFHLLDAAGKFLLAPGGEFAVHADCCCHTPLVCTICRDSQPPLSVVISGACTDQDECDGVGDTSWAFTGYGTTDGCCWWYWHDDDPDPGLGMDFRYRDFWIIHNPVSGVTEAACWGYYTGSHDEANFGGHGGCGWLQDISGEVRCDTVTNHLQGVFTLAGTNAYEFDCAGCTATVELDP